MRAGRTLSPAGQSGRRRYGAVYKARDATLDRVVALKVLPAHRLNDADAVARFQREAKALARLSHPNIIQAYDSGEDRGRHFLVMEFVEGQSLLQVLRQHGALPPTVAADFIHQAALGLQHAHEKGLIHRDVKPGNLLVASSAAASSSTGLTVAYRSGSPRHAGAVVKLLDLGLARFMQDQIGDSHLTQEGMGVGTPDYMAPEQFRDALHADARTDVYGLGCTLYHLVAGQVPFPGSSHSEKAHAHLKKEPVPLDEHCPQVPGGLALVAARMMAKHPSERFQTAGEVADALAPFVAGASQSMMRLRQTGLWQAPVRRSKRWRKLVWLAGAAAAALIVGGLITAWPALFGTGRGAANAGAGGEPKSQGPLPQGETIENGLTVAKNGRGQFTTITEALAAVKPGMTVRVLDDATYAEALNLTLPSRYAGLTLEAVNGATLAPANLAVGVRIVDVPRITLRGFRCRPGEGVRFMIVAGGRTQGLHLDDLEIRSSGGTAVAISLEGLSSTGELSVVDNCTIQGVGGGLRISGADNYTSPMPCGRVALRNNTVLEVAQHAIFVLGCVKEIQVTGNRVAFAGLSGIQLENLLPGTEEILVANNTLFECQNAFRLWDDARKDNPPRTVRMANNLTLGGRTADMVYVDSGGKSADPRGPGDGRSLLTAWSWSNNWRETEVPKGGDLFSRSWIPPGPTDTRRESIELLSRDPANTKFLRPAKDSPLATGGVGGDLPKYVGAMPPEGVERWDWDKTWKARAKALK
jgi:tRNA A-37 threonylcarbamoyl transferase component Bud32